MGAGTAQKIALNMLSTMMATRLGHVHDGYMVNLNADNLKLKGRARRIVQAVAECNEDDASVWLDRAGGSVKAAILHGGRGRTPGGRADSARRCANGGCGRRFRCSGASASSAQRNAS